MYTHDEDLAVTVHIDIEFPTDGISAGPPPTAIIREIFLKFASMSATRLSDALQSISWDKLQPILELPSLETLVIAFNRKFSDDCYHDSDNLRAFLSDVFEGRSLIETLPYDKLIFATYDSPVHVVVPAPVVPTTPDELVVGEKIVSLTARERADWLLCLEHHRERFLQDLLARHVDEEDAQTAAEADHEKGKANGEPAVGTHTSGAATAVA
ncbi:hypothetical protein PsYK624_152940 [Phanerochaete sordida]|uniref:Uncharacterized protein n=1 Tax=Phanerochaete sordida TaxID=48140 RepID=A0A9P3LLU3_9APHY|nr:hypothetical protein PsYK624_152940 [Phanerochaete sordida]